MYKAKVREECGRGERMNITAARRSGYQQAASQNRIRSIVTEESDTVKSFATLPMLSS